MDSQDGRGAQSPSGRIEAEHHGERKTEEDGSVHSHIILSVACCAHSPRKDPSQGSWMGRSRAEVSGSIPRFSPGGVGGETLDSSAQTVNSPGSSGDASEMKDPHRDRGGAAGLLPGRTCPEPFPSALRTDSCAGERRRRVKGRNQGMSGLMCLRLVRRHFGQIGP